MNNQDTQITKIQQYLRQFTVGIAGVGGLGSNCAVSLARTGVGKFILVDFDRVSSTNLNRQYYFQQHIGLHKVIALREVIHWIDPDIKVQAIVDRLTATNLAEIFHSCDVLVEAFDGADQKQMIAEAWLSLPISTPLVMGSGIGGYSRLPLSSRSYDRLIICGDHQTEVSDQNPPLAPRVAMVANLQANEVLNLLLNNLLF